MRNEQFGMDIHVSGTNIKEWLNQPHKWIVEKNRMLLDIEKVIAEAPYLGCGPDKHDPDITMHLFEVTLHGEKSWIIVGSYLTDQRNCTAFRTVRISCNILQKEEVI